MEDCNVVLCEKTDWWLGTLGVCNNATGLCDCPDGYSGQGVTQQFNDCHLSIRLRTNAAAVMLAATLMTLFGVLSFIIREGRKYYNTKRALQSNIERVKQYSGVRESTAIQASLRRAKGHREIQETVLHRYSVILMIDGLFAISLIGLIPCLVLLLQDPARFRYTVPYTVDLPIGMSFNCFFCAVGVVCYLHYTTLPNVPRMGTLLGVRSILVRKPQLVYKWIKWHVILCTLGHGIIWIIFPHVAVNNPALIYLVEDSQIILIILIYVELGSLYVIISIVVLKLFDHALKAAGNTKKDDVLVTRLKVAKDNIRGVQMMVAMTPIITILLIYVLTPDGRRVFTIAFTILILALNAAVFYFSYMMARELIEAPKRRERNIKKTMERLTMKRKKTVNVRVIQTIKDEPETFL